MYVSAKSTAESKVHDELLEAVDFKLIVIKWIDMLNNLRNFIEENKKDILTFIGNSRRPMNLDYDNDIFEKLLKYLVAGFPICDPYQSTHAEFDKMNSQ